MSITLRVHSLDGHDEGTLSLGAGGEIVMSPRNTRGQQALSGLLRTKPRDQSGAAWLHHLLHVMPGRTSFERDDWVADPHGHERLQLQLHGQPWATVWMDGDRLQSQTAPDVPEHHLRHLLDRFRSHHWSDRDLFHALPELLTGRLRAVPFEQPQQPTQQYALVPASSAPPRVQSHPPQTTGLVERPLGKMPGDTHVGAPEAPPSPVHGKLVRVVGGTGRMNYPANVPNRPGQVPMFLSPPEITAGAMSAHLQAQHGYQQSLMHQREGMPGTAVWGVHAGHEARQQGDPITGRTHHVGFLADHRGNVWSREGWNDLGVAHPHGVGNHHWNPEYHYDRSGLIPAAEPHFRFETHPELRAFLDEMVRGGNDEPGQWRDDHYHTVRGQLGDWLDERGHPAANDVRAARFPDEAMDAIARHEAKAYHAANPRAYFGRGGVPERYAGWVEPPQPWEGRASTLPGESHSPPLASMPALPSVKPPPPRATTPAALPEPAPVGTGPAAREPSPRFFPESTMLGQHHPEKGPTLPEFRRPVFIPKHIWDHLTPAEQGFFSHPSNADKTQKALAHYTKMASHPVQDVAALAGEAAKDWYNESEPVVELFGAHGPLFTRLQSANSTRNGPLRNLIEATALYRAWAESGLQGHDPSHHAPIHLPGQASPTTLPRFMLQLAKEPGMQPVLFPSRAVPTGRIFSDPANHYAALSGPKTTSFAIDLDPFDHRRWTAVTNDVWDAIKHSSELLDAKTIQEIWGGKNIALYPLASAGTRRVASERGWEPRQAQAAQWVATRAMAGLARAGLTPEQIVKYLTHEHVRNTSDSFLRHFVENPRVRESLRRIDSARGSHILEGVDALAAGRREAATGADRPTGPVFADAAPNVRRLALDLARRASRHASSYRGNLNAFADAVLAAKRDSGARFGKDGEPERDDDPSGQ